MNKSKIFMITSIIILCVAILGSTFAYYSRTLFDDLTVDTITNGLDYYIVYANGQNIDSATLDVGETYTSGTNTGITLYKKDNTYDIYGHIYLDINDIGTAISNSNAIKYTLVNNNEVLAVGSLKGAKKDDSLLIKANIPLSTTQQIYYIYIWMDQNEVLDANLENQTLSLTVRCEATMKMIDASVNMLDYITNLYTNTNKTTVTNNGITYNYATSVSLMNDRLGGTTKGYDGGNIRYYGANPNNYIDIGDVYTKETIINNYENNRLILSYFDITDSNSCYEFFDCSTNYTAIGQLMMLTFTDEASCNAGLQNYYHISDVHEMCGTTTKNAGDPKLYRVIGLFKNVEMTDGTKQDLIKVIREDSIGNFAWDFKGTNSDNYTLSNDWHQSTLKTILNDSYYNSGSTTHNYINWLSDSSPFGSSEVFGNPKDFDQIGLNSSVHNKIATVKWNLGAWGDSQIYPNEIYVYEREDAKCEECTYEPTWPGKVALMYPSDYGYATDFSTCEENLFNYYEDTDCYDKDWLFSLSKGNMIEWLLTPDYYNLNGAWYSEFGCLISNGFPSYERGVRPVFYLKSELNIVSGNGSKATPYVIH